MNKHKHDTNTHNKLVRSITANIIIISITIIRTNNNNNKSDTIMNNTNNNAQTKAND